MLVKTMAEKEIYDIGHAFGYYDYGQETGMTVVLDADCGDVSVFSVVGI